MLPKPACINANVPLAPLTTLHLGGAAEFLATPSSIEELIAAVQWARESGLPISVLGGGSNVIVADSIVHGLAIHPTDSQIEWVGDECRVGAGRTNGQLIADAVAHGRGGLSWLVGVPGEVGGTVAGNAGSRTEWIGSYVVWVDTVDRQGQLRRLEPAECAFEYRQSAFQTNELIIARVGFVFQVVDAAAERQIIAAAAQTKQKNQPIGTMTAGCMFRNVTAPDPCPPRLAALVDPATKTIAAWKLVAEVEMAGYQMGGMKISDHHANFLINTGAGTSDQAIQLMSLVKQRVRDTLHIQLHDEIRLIGY